jgi:hypothetical protein
VFSPNMDQWSVISRLQDFEALQKQE